ncbi:MAG: FliA/WhiG family RNA polymerase sigma factor [Planctomycetota bacterium]
MAEKQRASAKKAAPKAASTTAPKRTAGAKATAPLEVAPQAATLSELMSVDAGTLNLAEHTTDQLWELYREEADQIAKAFGLERVRVEAEAEDEVPEEDGEARSEDQSAESDSQGEEGETPTPTAEIRPSRSPALKDLPKTPRLEALRNELIERYYPLVRYIAERLLQTLPKSIELDDLISAGQFGLMDAIRGFDPSRGIKFKTYCSTRIRGSILDQLRSQDWVPRLVRLRASKIERAYQRLTGEFGREPTHAELARELQMDHGELAAEMEQAQAKTMFSLSEKWDDDDDGAVEKIETIEDDDAIDPVVELNRRDLMKYITRSLTHKERFIIEQYYQFGHTMREIGEMLALTESRVCQIHSNVIGRLKQLLSQRNDTLSN